MKEQIEKIRNAMQMALIIAGEEEREMWREALAALSTIEKGSEGVPTRLTAEELANVYVGEKVYRAVCGTPEKEERMYNREIEESTQLFEHLFKEGFLTSLSTATNKEKP